ncbi:hypothetical protein ASG29_11620 [Sphingomonas sp. Leaf412]|uniref:DoxX family protein n=1 Tax=Sphingomonas sp. Leaf412 TaxID=1736370 RepID=UPI0006F3376A|nr:DoxX family protein [Sphingomonas sp. Leaf412]KQT32427.1 hypothetical protein ASG29_11620 [Sphingomonas sp. Leaf412]
MTTIAADSTGRRIARAFLIAFYAVAGVAHLIVTDAMVRIVPPPVPFPRAVVIATGLCEIAGAIALLSPRWRVAAGRALALYALCVWPANMWHAVLDLRGGTGLPLAYHAPRLMVQPLVIWWALWASGAVDRPFRRLRDRPA